MLKKILSLILALSIVLPTSLSYVKAEEPSPTASQEIQSNSTADQPDTTNPEEPVIDPLFDGRESTKGMSKKEVDEWVDETLEVIDVNGKKTVKGVNVKDIKSQKQLRELTDGDDVVTLNQVEKQRNVGLSQTLGLSATVYAASKVTITPGTRVNYDSWSTNTFNAGGHAGVCMEPSQGTPRGTFTYKVLNNNLLKYMWYKYKKSPSTFKMSGISNYAGFHATISYAYCKDLKGLTNAHKTKVKNLTSSLKSELATKLKNANFVNEFATYTLYYAPNGKQDISWLVGGPSTTGGVKITKASSVSSFNMSVDGAKYQLYTNAACTTKAKSSGGYEIVLTISGGTASYSPYIAPGTYYLKETVAPTGYQRDTAAHKISISKEKTTTPPTFKDTPIQFTVNYRSDANGKITGKTKETVYYKKVPTGSTESPNKNYSTTVWKADKNVSLSNGAAIKAGDPLTMAQIKTVVVTQDVTFTVYHEKSVLPVHYRSDSNGTITGTIDENIEAETNPSGSTEKPNENYYTTNWTCDKNVTLNDGTIISANQPMTMEQIKEVFVEEELTFIVHHAPNPRVYYVSDSHGEITGIEEEIVKKGKNPSGTEESPSEHYYTTKWTADKAVTLEDGTTIPAGSTIKEDQIIQIIVTEDITFTVHHEPIMLHVEYKSDDNGTITGKTSEDVMEGDNPTGTTETPNEHYHTAFWTCDKNVVLENETVIPAGSSLSYEQLLDVVVTEDLIFTVHHEITKVFDSPVKIKDVSNVKKGDIFKYTIEQKLNTYLIDYDKEAYESLVLSDILPEEVEYVSSRIYPKTDPDGSLMTYFSVAPTENDPQKIVAKCTYPLSLKSADTNNFAGKTIVWEIKVKATDKIFKNGGEFSNASSTIFDADITRNSNQVVIGTSPEYFAPIKYAVKAQGDKTNKVLLGRDEAFEYIVEQQLHKTGVDYGPATYEAPLSITDTLPQQIIYSAQTPAYMTDDSNNAIAGTVTYNASTRLLTWTEDSSNRLTLNGKKVYLHIPVKTRTDIAESWENTATTHVDEEELPSNVVVADMNNLYYAPSKSASATQVRAGDQYTYTINQKINTSNIDYNGSAYDADFTLTDALPDEVDFVSLRLTDSYGNAGSTGNTSSINTSGNHYSSSNDATLTASYNSSNHTVTLTDASGEDKVPLEGQTYTIEITVAAKSNLTLQTESWDNQATTEVDDKELDSQVVTVNHIPTYYAPTKQTSKNSAQVSESYTYTIFQKVHTAGNDYYANAQQYRTPLCIKDALPNEVEFEEADAYYTPLNTLAEAEAANTSQMTALSAVRYSRANHEVTWQDDVAPNGGYIVLKIKVHPISTAYQTVTWNNKATTTVDNETKESEEVPVSVLPTYEAPKKTERTPAKNTPEAMASDPSVLASTTGYIKRGEEYTYTIKQKIGEAGVTYPKNQAYETFDMTDVLPSEVQFVSVEVSDSNGNTGEDGALSSSGAFLSYGYESSTRTVYLTSLDKGTNTRRNITKDFMKGQTITMTITVKAKKTLDFVNNESWTNYSITSFGPLPSASVSSNIATTILIPEYYAPSKESNKEEVAAGEEYTYTITQPIHDLGNDCPSDWTDLYPTHNAATYDSFAITDPLPNEAEYISATASYTDKNDATTQDCLDCSYASNTGILTCTPSNSLTLNGGYITVTVQVRAKRHLSFKGRTEWTNAASSTIDGEENPSDEVLTKLAPDTPAPVKSASTRKADPGDVYTYTIEQKVGEAGKTYPANSHYTKFNVSDELPAEVEFLSMKVSDSLGNAGKNTSQSGGADLDVNTVGPDEFGTLTFDGNELKYGYSGTQIVLEGKTMTNTFMQGQTITMEIKVKVKEALTHENSSSWNNKATTTFDNNIRKDSNVVTVTLNPDYPTPTKAASTEVSKVGDTFTYSIQQKINTPGEDCADDYVYDYISIEDALPNEVDFVSMTFSDSLNHNDNNGVMTFDNNTLYGRYNEDTHTVSISNTDNNGDKVALNEDFMQGQTITVNITVRTRNYARVTSRWLNEATTHFDKKEFTSNKVPVIVEKDGNLTIGNIATIKMDDKEIPSTPSTVDEKDPYVHEPVKETSKTQVEYDEEYTYTVTQKLNTVGEDYVDNAYESFVFSDALPQEVMPGTLTVKLYDSEDHLVENFTDKGTTTFDAPTNTVTWTANNASQIPLTGGYLKFFIPVKVYSAVEKRSWDNKATILVNDNPQNTNEVTVSLKDIEFKPKKSIQKSKVNFDETFDYTITKHLNIGGLDYADGEPDQNGNWHYKTPLVISDELDSRLTFMSATAYYRETSADAYTPAAGMVVYDAQTHSISWSDAAVNNGTGVILKGGDVKIVMQAKIATGDAQKGEDIPNTATASYDGKTLQSNEVNVQASDDVYHPPVKTVAGTTLDAQNRPSAKVNTQYSYTITQKLNELNEDYFSGNHYATNLKIKDTLPQAVSFVSATAQLTENGQTTSMNSFLKCEEKEESFEGDITQTVVFDTVEPYPISSYSDAEISITITVQVKEEVDEIGIDSWDNHATTYVDGCEMDSNIVTVYAQHVYWIKTNAINATITESEENIPEGATRVVEFEANPGFEFLTIRVDKEYIDPSFTSDSTHPFTMTENNGHYVMTFADIDANHTVVVIADNTYYNDPEKIASKECVEPGESYTYTITQPLNEKNVNTGADSYSSFVFSDTLPNEVSYDSLDVHLFDRNENEVFPAPAGTVSAQGQTVTWTPNDLEDIPLEGGQIQFIVHVTTDESPENFAWDNTATIGINDVVLTTNTVTVNREEELYSPEKETSKTALSPNEQFTYTITQPIHQLGVDTNRINYDSPMIITDDLDWDIDFSTVTAKAYYSRPAGTYQYYTPHNEDVEDPDMEDDTSGTEPEPGYDPDMETINVTAVTNEEVDGISYDQDTHTVSWTDSEDTFHDEYGKGKLPLFGGTIKIVITARPNVTEGKWPNTAKTMLEGETRPSNTVENFILNDDLENPVKEASKSKLTNYKEGFSYTITQPVNTTGKDYTANQYSTALVISDPLPEEVDYVGATASWDGHDVSTGISYNSETRTVTWTDANETTAWSGHIPLTGKPVVITINVRGNDDSLDAGPFGWNNRATTSLDGYSLPSNKVNVFAVDNKWKIETEGVHVDVAPDIENIPNGDTRTVTWEVEEGYYLDQIIIDGTPLENIDDYLENPKYTFENITQDHTIKVVATRAPITANLTIEKEVEGNYGSRAKVFSFAVEIHDASPLTRYNIIYGNNQTSYIDTDSDGDGYTSVYLADGESVSITNLPENTAYKVTEQFSDYAAEYDITSSGYINQNQGNSRSTTVEHLDADETVSFTNTRDKVTPTGLINDYWWISLIAVGAIIGGAAFMQTKKRKRDANV